MLVSKLLSLDAAYNYLPLALEQRVVLMVNNLGACFSLLESLKKETMEEEQGRYEQSERATRRART